MLNLAGWLAAGSFIHYCNGRAAGGVIALAVVMSRVLDIGVLFVLELALHMHMGGTATAVVVAVVVAATSTAVVVSSMPMHVPMSSSSVVFALVVLVRSIGGSSSGG